ncbi:MAG: response regulator transcription factor [Woeseiaceae bacterium]|nr:response regulator transcription factor [Woeseiaceae bacterium]
MTHVLIVEDNADLAFGLRSNLELEGYEVTIAATGTEGLEAARARSCDLIVLDVMLPEMDGYELLRRLRESDRSTPVLMLTARGEEIDKVRGLRTGADDYVTKPFGLMELLARIEALLRRSGESSDDSRSAPIELRDFVIEPQSRTVTRNDQAIDLAPKEFDLLVELIRRQGAVVSREELMRAVWGHSAAVVSRTVDTHIAELRKKLADSSETAPLIVTVRKAGYRIDPG